MGKFFNNIINTLVRDLDYNVRVLIGLAFIIVATIALYKSIRKKNDLHPIAIGWMVLFLVCTFLGIIYICL